MGPLYKYINGAMKNIQSYELFEKKPYSEDMRTFVRFGKLGLVKQEGFGSDTFHAPPAPRGFYAMPIRFQEYFLVSSIEKTQAKYLGIPKRPANDAPQEEWEAWSKKWKERFSEIRHEFAVDTTVELWHHLDVPNNEVISRHNSWVKTSYKTWLKAIKKESVRLRAESLGPWGEDQDKGVRKRKSPGGINSVRKRTGGYSMDHFEVFFDTKVF